MVSMIYLGFQFCSERLSLSIKFSIFQNNFTNGAVKTSISKCRGQEQRLNYLKMCRESFRGRFDFSGKIFAIYCPIEVIKMNDAIVMK